MLHQPRTDPRYTPMTIDAGVHITGKNERITSQERSEHVDIGSDSSDTFDKFIYEEEMLDEIEDYYTEESTTEEIGLYNNLWADIKSPAIYFTAIDKPLNQTGELPKHTINEKVYLPKV
ncbi:12171_t:CDS:2 [Gigaspora margarita]|uniref:12171_t:CDS:1 n=1 Tax=Gigaspora margarita TaxID=4874 RepID=A0ABN7URL4_GIGMA|nr:12171_t:CDS:2 [Gigaspora margarita]